MELQACCSCIKGVSTASTVTASISRQHEYVCVAKNNELLLWATSAEAPLKLPKQAEDISCIAFISLPRSGKIPKLVCLIIGFISGKILVLHIPTGNILLQQHVHNGNISRIKVRTNPIIPLVGEYANEEEIVVLYSDSTLVLFESTSFIGAIQSEFMHQNEITNERGHDTSISFRKYRLRHSSSGQVIDVITTGRNYLHESKRSTMIVAVGKNPMISVYICEDNSLVTLATEVASKLKSSLFSYAKSWWPAPEEKEEIELPKGLKLTRNGKLEDPTRVIQCITRDGSSQLGAFADAFGRVCLLDLSHSPPIVIRMWKGYRDAQLAFFQASIIIEHMDMKTSHLCKYLAIYAPRRGILEVWKVRNGTRQEIMHVGNDCVLLNSASYFGHGLTKSGGRQHCYLLHKGTGELCKIVPTKPQELKEEVE